MAAEDWIDRVVGRWSALVPGYDLRALHVTGRLSRVSTRIARIEAERFARDHLNRGDVGLLSTLRVAGDGHRLSPTQLLRGLMLSSAGVTGRLDRLQRQGLVRRVPDPFDRRGVQVELTPRGLELIDRVVAENAEAETALVSVLTAEERETLAGLLKKLLAALEPPSGD